MAANQAEALGALGDPSRRAIFESLAERPRPVGELARELPITRPAVSQHLKVLKGAGLVTDRPAGTRRIYARVLEYEPPDRVVFSWDISPRWQIETDPDRTSEVEVRFIAEGPERTRVELEHRNLDRHGDGWEGVRAGVDSEGGWPLYLQRFADVAAA